MGKKVRIRPILTYFLVVNKMSSAMKVHNFKLQQSVWLFYKR
jgi:hypothetical protein